MLFARTRSVRRVKKSSIDRRLLITDPHLREEVARAIGDRLRATPLDGSSVDEVEAVFTEAVLQTAELIVPPKERRMRGLEWNGNAQAEAEFSEGRKERDLASAEG